LRPRKVLVFPMNDIKDIADCQIADLPIVNCRSSNFLKSAIGNRQLAI